jgi:hypothetical protein
MEVTKGVSERVFLCNLAPGLLLCGLTESPPEEVRPLCVAD